MNDHTRQAQANLQTGHALLLLASLAWLSFFGPTPSKGQAVATYHDRADRALQSFMLKFWRGDQQYVRQQFPDNGALTGYWTYANAWDAVLDGVERTGGEQYVGLIETFYLGQDERGWWAGYYDDECWMTLALMRAYDLTGNAKYLTQAQALYGDIMGGWDTTCCGAIKGGVWWDRGHTQKATAANAGAALAGARLYERTGVSSYLNFSQQVYSFWYSNMVNFSSFQVCDHINTDGTKVWWKFSYNEGLMIGAACALERVTGNSAYRTNADNFARFMIQNEVVSTFLGLVLSDGSNSGCGGDCHEFKGPAFRYLSLLYASGSQVPKYYSALKGSADSIWTNARNANAMLFSVDWLGPPQGVVDQAQDNAACAALSRFAQIYGGYPGSGIPLNQYEAENATLHHVQLEALKGNFSAWGYVTGWNGDNQWVEFGINCAVAGSHTLGFRYSAGAGDAVRCVSVNGVDLAPGQRFPATPAWTNYSTATMACNLPAGRSTVRISYDSSQNSSNGLNLDNLIVAGDPMPQIQITDLQLTARGSLHLAWTATAGQTYRVQYSVGLTNEGWNDLGVPVTASNATASVQDPTPVDQKRFYRIVSP